MDPHAHEEAPDDPVKFHEAIQAFRARVPMTEDEWDALQESEREFAFTVAGVAQAELVADVYEAIERAIEDGTDIDDFRAEIGADLEDSWGGEEPGRLETIFRTNVLGAYNAGRYSAATAPAVKRERPYWRFDGVDDSRTTEDICEPIIEAKVVLPANHPWWRTHYPPLHYQCRSLVSTLTEEQAQEEGITSSPPEVHAMPGFGAAPSDGGTDWEPDTEDLPTPIREVFEEEAD